MNLSKALRDAARLLRDRASHGNADMVEYAADEIERLTVRAVRAETACRALLAALEPMNFDSNWPAHIDDLEAAIRQAAGLHAEDAS